jgi:CheY-like chemotaxis protein
MSDSSDKKPLGKILLQQKLVSPGELDQLLERQKRAPGSRLASTAAESGQFDEVDLLRALSEQLGVPAIDLNQVVVPLANLKLVPHDVARQYLILPFSLQENTIMLAMADPNDQRVIDEIEFVTGRSVAPYVALHEQLQKVVDLAYKELDRGESYYVGPNAPRDYLIQLGIKPRDAAPPVAATPPASALPKRPPTQPTPSANAFTPRAGTRLDPAAEMDFSDVLGALGPSAPSAPVAPTPSAAQALSRDVHAREASQQGISPRGGTKVRDISALDAAFDSRVARLPTAERVPVSSTSKTVLVVDDEDDIRRMLRRVLQERGYRVVEASRGTEALQAVRDNTLDCILLDAMLPEIHGFDICRRIKSSQRFGHIPIIMVSAVYRGWRFAEDLRESYGVTAFLEKPFKISDVVAAVERAVEGKPPEASQDEQIVSAEAEASLKRGIDAFARGDVDQAISDLKAAVAIEPSAFRLHYHLGLLYGRKENVFDAIHSLETALTLSSRNFAALKNLAVLYQRAGFKHKAVESWERALRSAPDEETRRGIKEHLMGLL